MIPEWISLPAGDLMKKILTKEPGKRPSIEEIKNHPFLRGLRTITFGINMILIDESILMELEKN